MSQHYTILNGGHATSLSGNKFHQSYSLILSIGNALGIFMIMYKWKKKLLPTNSFPQANLQMSRREQ